MLDDYFQNCMYFASSQLHRAISRMAEDEFIRAGLSPTYAYLLMAVHDKPGITQKELGETLHVAPSTVTRFIEKLVHKGLVNTQSVGKMSHVQLTELGKERIETIREAWKILYRRYSEILGKDEGKAATKMLYDLAIKLEGKG